MVTIIVFTFIRFSEFVCNLSIDNDQRHMRDVINFFYTPSKFVNL